MRKVLLATVLLTATAATAQSAQPLRPNLSKVPAASAGEQRSCRDTIHAVRTQNGLPALDRGTASPGEELLIKAVDHRIAGCAVMVMHRDTRDIRPLPTTPGVGQLRKIQ